MKIDEWLHRFDNFRERTNELMWEDENSIVKHSKEIQRYIKSVREEEMLMLPADYTRCVSKVCKIRNDCLRFVDRNVTVGTTFADLLPPGGESGCLHLIPTPEFDRKETIKASILIACMVAIWSLCCLLLYIHLAS